MLVVVDRSVLGTKPNCEYRIVATLTKASWPLHGFQQCNIKHFQMKTRPEWESDGLVFNQTQCLFVERWLLAQVVVPLEMNGLVILLASRVYCFAVCLFVKIHRSIGYYCRITKHNGNEYELRDHWTAFDSLLAVVSVCHDETNGMDWDKESVFRSVWIWIVISKANGFSSSFDNDEYE